MSDFHRTEFTSRLFGDESRQDRTHLDLDLEPYHPVSLKRFLFIDIILKFKQKIYFSIQLSLTELNISEHGFLETTRNTFSVLGSRTGPHDSIEVFGDEVSMVLNSTSLFRDTAYTVILPAADDFIARIHRSLNSHVDYVVPEIYQGSPLGVMRFYIMVS